jgi:hypothetical protein
MTIFPGIITFICLLIGLQSQWVPAILLLTPVSLALIFLNTTIKHNKIVSKYRDSEEGLIKP